MKLSGNKLRMSVISVMVLLGICLVSIPASIVVAREAQVLVCGNDLESELNTNTKDQLYAIELAPQDSILIQVYPSGGGFLPSVELLDAGNNVIATSERSDYGSARLPLFAVSSLGYYGIRVFAEEGLGSYRLQVGCVFADGTFINPGDDPTIPSDIIEFPVDGSTTSSSGMSFPGIDSVDFSNIAPFPLTSGTPMTGGITPRGEEILGYSLDVDVNDKLDLTFTRASGNLNLGLVVLSPDNQVVFQASLVTSESLTTRFTLPSAGKYTIGVFRIDLLPPTDPQPTAFQVQATLNPS